MREATVERKTRETEVRATLVLDQAAPTASVATGIGFFDHMLEALSKHAGMSLALEARGDLHVDGHHTVEDCGIVLGQALKQALGDRSGIRRFGSAHVPLDEALSMAVVDVSGRPFLVFEATFAGERTGGFETQLAEEFFRAVAVHAGITVHLRSLYGANDHHRIESLFKAFARALREACSKDPGSEGIPSTKGVL